MVYCNNQIKEKLDFLTQKSIVIKLIESFRHLIENGEKLYSWSNWSRKNRQNSH